MNNRLYGKLYHTVIDFPAVINLPFRSPLPRLYNRTIAATTQLFAGSIDFLLTKDRRRYKHIRNFRNMAKNKLLGMSPTDYNEIYMEELAKE